MTKVGTADVLITNGHAFTADAEKPWAEAVGIRGNRIVFVGSAAEAAAWRGARTEVIDAGGRTVMPGFIDSHFHLLLGSLELDGLQLDTVTSMEGLADAVRSYAAAHPQRAWLDGYRLRYTVMRPDQPLNRHVLDALAPDRPLYISAYDGHTVWANTEGLTRAGLLYGRETPAGSEIVMDAANGTATGELREPGAFDPLRDLLPKPDAARKRQLLRAGLARLAAAGITSVHNMDGDEEQIRLYAALEDLGELTARVYIPYSVKPETTLENIATAAEWRRQFQGGHVRAGAIKLFMDGVLESYTALLVEEYGDDAGNRGSALYTADHFNRIAVEADRLGLQIFVHACGDGAVRRALDGYAYAQEVNGRRDSRHRVEHVELIHADDLGRFAELGVIAAIQPYHTPLRVDDGDIWPDRAGRARWSLSFAWQTLREAGTRLAFGSDWPVVSMDPMLGIHAALNRELWAPGLPDQTQKLEDVLIGYTRDAAYAEFQEQAKGTLRAGMLADLVILSEDLFSVPKKEIRYARPLLTMCDGRIVFRDGV